MRFPKEIVDRCNEAMRVRHESGRPLLVRQLVSSCGTGSGDLIADDIMLEMERQFRREFEE